MTLVTRLSLFFLSMLAVVLLSFSVTLYILAQNYLDKQADERLSTLLNTVSNIIETGPEGVEWEPGNRTVNLDSAIDHDQFVWLVEDDQGHVLDRSKSQITLSFMSKTFPTLQFTPQADHKLHWSGAYWKVAKRWIHPDAHLPDHEPPSEARHNEHQHSALSVTVGVSLLPIRAMLMKLLSALIGLSLAILIVAFVAGRFVCRRALLPVNRMSVAAREINADDPAQRLPAVSTHDELEDLNRSFNELLGRFHVTFERQRQFTGDASHQLRTPLTAILGQIEVVLRRERSAAEYRQVLEKVQRRASHLAGMTESLLFLARADSEARLPTSTLLNLNAWLPEHLQSWSQHVRASDIQLQDLSSSPPSTIAAQPELLAELLDILLDNACKYSTTGTPITLVLQQVETAVLLSVEDHGCGIEEADLANVFVPFYRSEGARRRGIDGVGLGLSIARRLAEVFGAELTVVSKPSQGSCFTLRLPTHPHPNSTVC